MKVKNYNLKNLQCKMINHQDNFFKNQANKCTYRSLKIQKRKMKITPPNWNQRKVHYQILDSQVICKTQSNKTSSTLILLKNSQKAVFQLKFLNAQVI